MKVRVETFYIKKTNIADEFCDKGSIFVCGNAYGEIFEDLEISIAVIVDFCKKNYTDIIDLYKKTNEFLVENTVFKSLDLNVSSFLEYGLDYRIIEDFIKSIVQNVAI